MRIETIFGSQLYVVGLDKPQRVEGDQWDGCVLDESCDLKPGTFDLNVLPALSWREGWCWRIGVPKRHGVGAAEFKKFCLDARAGKIKSATAFSWTSGEIVPPHVLEYAQSVLDVKDYNEQFNARWETVGGGIFYSFNHQINVRPCAYNPALPIVVGSDFNVDPMCWIFGHVIGNRFEVFDELFLRDTNTYRALDVVYGRYGSHRAGFEFYGDATGRARKTSATESDYKIIMNDERFQELGRVVHYPKGNPLVADRFASCNAMLCSAAGIQRLHIDPRCEHLIWDLENRHFKPGTMIPDDTGDAGHITDALGYPIHFIFPIRVLLDVGAQDVVVVKH